MSGRNTYLKNGQRIMEWQDDLTCFDVLQTTDRPPGVPPKGLTFHKHLIVKGVRQVSGFGITASLRPRSSFLKAKPQSQRGLRNLGNQMFLNVSQLSQRKPVPMGWNKSTVKLLNLMEGVPGQALNDGRMRSRSWHTCSPQERAKCGPQRLLSLTPSVRIIVKTVVSLDDDHHVVDGIVRLHRVLGNLQWIPAPVRLKPLETESFDMRTALLCAETWPYPNAAENIGRCAPMAGRR